MNREQQHSCLTATGIGKKFYQNWLFKDLDFRLESGEKLIIKGTNGSGKSTLLRIIAGQLGPNTGKITLEIDGDPILIANRYKYISWSGPNLSLFPDLSCRKQLALHFQFKNCLLPSENELLHLLKLEAHADKALRDFSSGMLQRLEVGLALFTDSPILMLDEPTSNLDEENANFMLDLIQTYSKDRICIIASNMKRDFGDNNPFIRLGKS